MDKEIFLSILNRVYSDRSEIVVINGIRNKLKKIPLSFSYPSEGHWGNWGNCLT